MKQTRYKLRDKVWLSSRNKVVTIIGINRELSNNQPRTIYALSDEQGMRFQEVASNMLLIYTDTVGDYVLQNNNKKYLKINDIRFSKENIVRTIKLRKTTGVIDVVITLSVDGVITANSWGPRVEYTITAEYDRESRITHQINREKLQRYFDAQGNGKENNVNGTFSGPYQTKKDIRTEIFSYRYFQSIPYIDLNDFIRIAKSDQVINLLVDNMMKAVTSDLTMEREGEYYSHWNGNPRCD